MHKRFKDVTKDGKLLLIKTNTYKDIKKFLSDTINQEDNENFLIYGSIGIGKSCTLALSVYELRKEQAKTDNLIIYINQPSCFTPSRLLQEIGFALKTKELSADQKQEFFTMLKEQFSIKNQINESNMATQLELAFVRSGSLGIVSFKQLCSMKKLTLKQTICFIIDQAPRKTDEKFTTQIIREFLGTIIDGKLFLCSSRCVKDYRDSIPSQDRKKLKKGFNRKKQGYT